jgi:hypothetical protein
MGGFVSRGVIGGAADRRGDHLAGNRGPREANKVTGDSRRRKTLRS